MDRNARNNTLERTHCAQELWKINERGIIGYASTIVMKAGILNAVDHGVPKRRKRAIVLAGRTGLLPLPTVLISRVVLLDRPEDGFLQLLERHVVGIPNRLES